ncbi:unnamed protein product [Ectocarpus sp. 12 AP-2014]
MREAGEVFTRALKICHSYLEADDPQMAVTLHAILGVSVREVGRPGEAEALFSRALEINETKFGDDHVDVCRDTTNVGSVYRRRRSTGGDGIESSARKMMRPPYMFSLFRCPVVILS